jgi:hypothetical protein
MTTASRGRAARPRRRRLSPVAGVLLGLLVACGYALVAGAFWTSTGSGTATASVTTLGAPSGVTASASLATVTVGFSGATAPAGATLSGYYVTRHTGATTSTACGTVAATPSTHLAPSATSCVDTSVPNGTHTYRVTAVFRTWTAVSAPSAAVVVAADSTPPTQALTVTGGANTHRVANTLYYRGTIAGSFGLTSSLTDSGSGPASVTFPAVTASGWTHPAQTVAPGTGTNPTKSFVSSTYAWTAGAASPGSHTVTGADHAGNTVGTTLDVLADVTAPTGGSLLIDGVAATASGDFTQESRFAGWSGTRTNFTADTGSGVASSVLTREFAAGTACTSYGTPTVVTGNVNETGTLAEGCYRYTLTGTDNVGNTSSLVLVVTTFNDTTGPTQTFTASGNAYVAGTTLYYRSAQAGSFTLTSAATDYVSGPASVRFRAISTTGWTHNDETITAGVGSHPTVEYTSSPYSWSANPTNPTNTNGRRPVATDHDGNAGAVVTLNFTIDNSAPTGGALAANGTTATGGGNTSNSATGTFTGTRTHYTTDTGSGVDTSVLTREVASWNGSACGTYAEPTTVAGTPSESNASTGCYRYVLTGTDRVGNVSSLTTVVRVTNGSLTQAVTVLGGGGSAVKNGSTVFFDPTVSGSLALRSILTDTASGPQRVEFPALAAGGWTHAADSITPGTGALPSLTYDSTSFAWTAGATAVPTYVVSGFTQSGTWIDTSIAIAPDTTGPTGGALVVNGAVGTSGGASSASRTGTWTSSVTSFNADAGAGYQATTLTRAFSPTLAGGACGAFGTPSTVPNANGTGLPAGCYRYTLTGTDVFGNTSILRVDVLVDLSAPTTTFTQVDGDAYLGGSTIYYRGSVAGSLTLSASVTDAQSGPASAQFPAIATTGWNHDDETVTNGAGSGATLTYTSSSYTWSANPSNPTGTAPRTITGRDLAGNTATTTAPTFVNDSSAPTGGALTVNGTVATGLGSTSPSPNASWTIGVRTDFGADVGSGVDTSVLTRASATWNGTACGTFGAATVISGTTAQTGMQGATCYRYVLSGTDHVGNVASLTTTVRTSRVTISSVTLNNAGAGNTSGVLNRGDTIVVQYSEAMAVGSLCSTWSGNTTNQLIDGANVAAVTIRNGGAANDYIEVTTTNAACNGGFGFGTLTLGDDGYLTATQFQTFRGATGTDRSTIAYNASTFTLTITLGWNSTQDEVNGSNPITPTTVATLAPAAGLTNVGGLGLLGPGTTATVRQF